MKILGFDILRHHAAASISKPKSEYDVVSSSGRAARRNPKIERTGEHGSSSKQLPPRRHLESIALARDAYRNTSGARIIEDQWLENAVGSEFKLSIQCLVENAAGEMVKPDSVVAAEKWFNKKWARNCNLKKDQHLNDFFRCSFASWFREGDHGILFDADFLATGKLAAYEADEFASLSESDIKLIPNAVSQANGVVFDAFGREIAYIRNKKGRGVPRIAISDAHVFLRNPDDPEANNFKLVRRDWRFNQARGIGRMIAPLGDILDAGEIKANEVGATKIQSSLPAIVKPSADDEAEDYGDMNPSKAPVPGTPNPAGGTQNPDDKNLIEYRNDYSDAFEGIGAKGIFADENDTIEFPAMTRPNTNTTAMLEWVQRYAGASVGLFDCYSGGRVNKAYTAFRGEMVLTWVSVYNAVKWFEREVKDWIGVRVLRFAIANHIIDQLPDGWEECLKWVNPQMPDVSVADEQDGLTKRMKNGGTSLAEQFGPEWQSIIEQQGRENKIAAKNGVSLARNEMKSGGAAKTSAQRDEQDQKEGKQNADKN
jgi:capsid protein